MKSKTLIVARREFLQRVKSKGFIIFTLLLPALMVGYILFVVAMAKAGGNVASRIAVVDLSGQVYAPLNALLTETLPNGQRKYTVEPVAATPATLPAVEATLQRQVRDGRYSGFLVIPADVLASNHAEYHARNVANMMAMAELQARLGQAVARRRLLQAGVAPDRVPQFLASFNLETLRVSSSGESRDQGQTFVLAYLLGGLLYGALIGHGVTFMRSVVEEKTSRVAEVILSAVDAFDLLLGKLLGVAGAALLQGLVWLLCLAAASLYGVTMASALSGNNPLKSMPHIGGLVYFCFAVFFLLGFLVYATLFAASGAIVSSEQESQQTQLPITLLLVLAFVLAPMVLNAPGSGVAVVLSLIPFFTPVLMTMRVIVSSPPLWQILLAIVLSAATVLGIVRVTAKIYRLGLLMTGKRPTLPEILRWLRYT